MARTLDPPADADGQVSFRTTENDSGSGSGDERHELDAAEVVGSVEDQRRLEEQSFPEGICNLNKSCFGPRSQGAVVSWCTCVLA